MNRNGTCLPALRSAVIGVRNPQGRRRQLHVGPAQFMQLSLAHSCVHHSRDHRVQSRRIPLRMQQQQLDILCTLRL